MCHFSGRPDSSIGRVFFYRKALASLEDQMARVSFLLGRIRASYFSEEEEKEEEGGRRRRKKREEEKEKKREEE